MLAEALAMPRVARSYSWADTGCNASAEVMSRETQADA